MPPELHWGKRTYLMGIVNVTPDSFSGDGLAPEGRDTDDVIAAAVAQGRAMVEAGADILDVGAESTRPRQAYGDHRAVDARTELKLAIPVVRALASELGDRAMVSIDTSKGVVAAAALDAGAIIVNDVWAATRDPGTADAVGAAPGSHLVLMHNQDEDGYRDGVYATVVAWLRDAIDAAIVRGVERDRLIVDPGIGFGGKGTEENLELLHRLSALKAELGLPVLVGTSRKRFIGELLGGAAPDERVDGTAATVALAVASGADIVRVHDVAPVARTLRVADAVVRR